MKVKCAIGSRAKQMAAIDSIRKRCEVKQSLVICMEYTANGLISA